MVKSDLGTKRIRPETGREFYDLNGDPIVSPYPGASDPPSFFAASWTRIGGRPLLLLLDIVGGLR